MKVLILGGPGTGKTTRLLEIVEEEIRRVGDVRKIAYVSFTRKAVREAVDRASKNIAGITAGGFEFFRTIHSLCFRQTGISVDRVMKKSDYRRIGECLGIRITGKRFSEDFDASSMSRGDRLLFMVDYARTTFTDLRNTWEYFGDAWDIGWFELERFSKILAKYKEEKNRVDFVDMLERFLANKSPLSVEAAVIDEAQDLTPLQWKVADLAFKNCRRLYIAGDDDQAIYEWSGADVKYFLNLGEDRREILSRSHRSPKKIHEFASKISSRISERYGKDWLPNFDEGTVRIVDDLSDIDTSIEGSWLMLSRNVCFFPTFIEECKWRGLPFVVKGELFAYDDIRIIRSYENLCRGQTVDGLTASDISLLTGRRGRTFDPECEYSISEILGTSRVLPWHEAFKKMGLSDRVFYRKILESGEDIHDPRFAIDTIHGVKGTEADNVVLLTDVTRTTAENMDKNPDAELRVFYVAATRAKKNLFVVRPQTNHYFRFVE